MSTPEALHQPVMLADTIQALAIKPDQWYIDATFGRGGHTTAILEKGAKVVALDFDQDAVEYGSSTLQKYLTTGKLLLARSNFAQLSKTVLQFADQTQNKFAGILFDFGTSVDQLTNQERGFSFSGTGPLDMRMDNRLGVTAAQLLAVLSEQQLADSFRDFGGEEAARAIAKAIVTTRKTTPIETTSQLVGLITRVKRNRGKLHPATKVFQALRIIVNSELDNISEALPQARTLIQPGGRIVTIAFHEGEDRLVKHFFKAQELAGQGEALDLVQPDQAEVDANPRSRSAKLRVFIKK